MRRPILAITLLFALGACGQATDLYHFDGDGSLDAVDCAPSDGLIHPGAADAVGDGSDNNDGDDINGNYDSSEPSGWTFFVRAKLEIIIERETVSRW